MSKVRETHPYEFHYYKGKLNRFTVLDYDTSEIVYTATATGEPGKREARIVEKLMNAAYFRGVADGIRLRSEEEKEKESQK